MSDAADFTIAALVQILRAGISYLKGVPPVVLYFVSFSLAIVEGAILANTLPTRASHGQRRLTLYPAVMLVLRILFDFISSAESINAGIGMGGTLAGLLLGPIFHGSSNSNDTEDKKKAAHAGSIQELSTILGTTRVASPRRMSLTSPPKPPRAPVMHHVIDVDNETSRAVLFTPAPSTRALDDGTATTAGGGYTGTTSDVRYNPRARRTSSARYTSGGSGPGTILEGDTVYMDATDREGDLPKVNSIKDTVRRLRAQAKEDDYNRRSLLQERDQVLADGDAARAFLLKHQAESLKQSMMESDKEAARTIFEYYNPPSKREKYRIDLRGLSASEAVQYCDEALKDIQEADTGNVLTVTLGRGKNADGSGKGKVKPTLKQFAKQQGIFVRESEDGSTLVLSLPTLRSPISPIAFD